MKVTFADSLKAIIVCLFSAVCLPAKGDHAPLERKITCHLVERVSFDWNHSGNASTFSLVRLEGNGSTFDRLTIDFGEARNWSLRISDGGAALLSNVGLSHLKARSLIPASKHFLFVSPGTPQANVYLILKGEDSGCCVGSLLVLTPDEHGKPIVVFRSPSHLLRTVEPVANSKKLAMIGQSSDSEVWALRNAQSYDPYRVYLLDRDQPARYDLVRSKAYTVAHYCQWHGPKYDERFVAVGMTTGSGHCHVISGAEFDTYRQKHPALFAKQ